MTEKKAYRGKIEISYKDRNECGEVAEMYLLATFWYMIHEDHTTGHLSVSKIVEVVTF